TNLRVLDLTRNKISDISPLRNLTTLQYLYLNGNPINDYNPIQPYFQTIKDKDFEI
ncbi:MAG: leucine-rich repeat domain-containing protein, partial [Methanobacterium sp.]